MGLTEQTFDQWIAWCAEADEAPVPAGHEILEDSGFGCQNDLAEADWANCRFDSG